MNALRWKYLLQLAIAACIIMALPDVVLSQKASIQEWKDAGAGLEYTEAFVTPKHGIGDSRLCLLRIDTATYDFCLVMATADDSLSRTVKDWCIRYDLIAGINAGMYDLQRPLFARGYMRDSSHINNALVKDGFNAFAVFNPAKPEIPAFSILDLPANRPEDLNRDYYSVFQSIRMIDQNAQPVYWEKKPMTSCSITALATDSSGNVLFVFSRSPYTANQLTDMLLGLNIGIRSAMYLEGGPECTLYINTPQVQTEKTGSFVSGSHPSDDNQTPRKMPNILGIRKK